jgi:4-diphosphocytidyl-2-C-methyl-D-erythritol kinase
MRVCSPAKLNLFLHVLGRRPDGYHDLQTLFQFIDLHDTLDFATDTRGEFHLDCPGLDLDPAENLIVRAALLLKEATGCRMGMSVKVDKRIPAGGGLGGGSSNAASTLVALNHLWQTGLDQAALKALGVRLGADVPIFIHGRSALAEGVGDRLVDAAPPEDWYVLAIPDCHVPTGQLFQQKQLTRNSPRITLADFLAGWRRNDFEPVTRVLYPEVDNALRILSAEGPAFMTGTGACVFAPHASESSARQAAEAARQRFLAGGARTRVLVTRGMNGSMLYEEVLAQSASEGGHHAGAG